MDKQQLFLKKAYSIPQLAHYTWPDSIMAILETKSLYCNPTWNFIDTEEYELGLKLISETLKKSLSNSTESLELSSESQIIFSKYFGDHRGVVTHVIDLIDYEISNIQNPHVKVYVTCFSEDLDSQQMRADYGGFVIHFNQLINIFADLYPKPFSTSMISRVSYDENEFRSWIKKYTLNHELSSDSGIDPTCLSSLDQGDRTIEFGTYLAEGLCKFAPNIKKPKYEYEREWRLKSIISEYNYKTDLHPRIKDGRRIYAYKPDATPTEDDPPKYFKKLEADGKFLAQTIGIPPGDVDKATEVMEYFSQNCLGPVTHSNLEKIGEELACIFW